MDHKPGLAIRILALAALGLGISQASLSQQSLAAQSGDLTNRYTSAEDVAAGAKAFRSHCATCHGRNAEGYRGPNLTLGRFRHGSSDAALFRNILNGVPGTSMAGVYIPDTRIWQVISYLRSISGTGKRESLKGFPEQGKLVFEAKGECSTCHVVSGAGGRRGTDLTEIGWRRSPEHLRRALLAPGEVIETNYRFVSIVMKNGEDVEGILLNEGTYSIQLLDQNENLVSISKAEAREISKPELSLMPDYVDAFSDQEFTDLIAYLYSLEGESKDD